MPNSFSCTISHKTNKKLIAINRINAYHIIPSSLSKIIIKIKLDHTRKVNSFTHNCKSFQRFRIKYLTKLVL